MRTIVQISDLHFGRHSRKTMEDLLTSVNEHRPDLVVFSGDFTQRARPAEFAEARQFLNRISQPKLVVPGNHDVPLYNVVARFLAPFKKYNHHIAPIGHPSGFFYDGEIAVLGLNTARRFTRKNGRVSVSQMSQIGRTFRDLPQRVFKALVTHHPLGVPSGEDPVELVGRSRLALKSISDAGVRLLLSGHHHQALSGGMTDIGGEESVLVVHAGTAISSRIRGDDGNTYNLISIVGDRVSVSVQEWRAGYGFREKRTARYVLQNGQWLQAK